MTPTLTELQRQRQHYALVKARLWSGVPYKPPLVRERPQIATRMLRPLIEPKRHYATMGAQAARFSYSFWPDLTGIDFGKPRLTCAQILHATARATGVSINDLVSPRRMKRLVMARHCAMWIAKQETSLSLPQIGRFIGGRDHSTVQHAICSVDDKFALFEAMIAAIRRELATVLNGMQTVASAEPQGTGGGKPVIVRCRDAGVWFGNLVSYKGREVQITNGRRMWYWKPVTGKTLSACAISGVDVSSKIAAPVANVALLEACEILTCTAEAARNLEAAAWKE